MDLAQFQQHRIIFENVELPKAALHIDHLGMYGNLPGMSDATSEWLWRFVICMGRPREDRSENVIRAAEEVLQLCRQHKGHLVANFAKFFSGPFEPTFYDDWVWTLEFLLAMAKERDVCHWTMPLLPGDPHYGRSWEEISADMQAGLEQLEKRIRPKRWWQLWK